MPVETLITIILAILGAIGTWTITVAGLVFWLASRFRAIENLIDAKLSFIKREHDRDVDAIWKRIRAIERQVHRLQLKVFGFAPLSMDEMLERAGELPDEPSSSDR